MQSESPVSGGNVHEGCQMYAAIYLLILALSLCKPRRGPWPETRGSLCVAVLETSAVSTSAETRRQHCTHEPLSELAPVKPQAKMGLACLNI